MTDVPLDLDALEAAVMGATADEWRPMFTSRATVLQLIALARRTQDAQADADEWRAATFRSNRRLDAEANGFVAAERRLADCFEAERDVAMQRAQDARQEIINAEVERNRAERNLERAHAERDAALARAEKAEASLSELADFFADLAVEAFTAPDAPPYAMLDSLRARHAAALARCAAATELLESGDVYEASEWWYAERKVWLAARSSDTGDAKT